MGTNFYMKRIPTEDDIQKMSTLALERKLVELQEYITDLNQEIHIGKRSCGWQFLFNHQNGAYFDPRSQDSLINWLKNPQYEIVDEYGDTYTFEEFWKMVTEWNANPRNIFNSESYTEWEKSQGHYGYDYPCDSATASRIYEMFGVYPKYYDFELDGLRYSTSTEFC